MTQDALTPGSEFPEHGQFVVLEHRVPPGESWTDHWDVMFESPGGLLTWASPSFPAESASWEVKPLPVHRAIYLDYEGPISGNRGCVRRLDRGRFRTQDRQVQAIVLELDGHLLRGRLKIEIGPDRCVRFTWMPLRLVGNGNRF